MDKKILFIGVNSSYSHTMLSYGYLRSFNEVHLPTFSWDYLECTVKEDIHLILDKVKDLKPDIITGTLYIFNHSYFVELLAQLKELLPKLQIYLGGPEFLGDNESFLRTHEHINGVIRGDETSFYKLFTNVPINEVNGLCCLDGKGYIDNGFSRFWGRLDDLPSPYQKGYLVKGKPFYQLETSRGCNGNCTFCTSSVSSSVNELSLSAINKELVALSDLGCKEVRVVDRTFNANKKRAIKMLELFRDKFSNMNFHLEVNPAILDEKFLELLSSFPKNRLHIEIGVQTLNDDVLRVIKRPATSQKQLEGLKSLLELNNFEVHADLISGLPNQSYQDVISDLVKLVNISPHEIQLETLKLLPGTPLRKIAEEYSIKFNKYPLYEVLETSTMNFKELIKLRHLSKMIDSFYNTPELQSIFIFSLTRDTDFIIKFLEFFIKSTPAFQKVSLRKRFLILFEYFKEIGDSVSYELLKFAWFISGFSPDYFGVKVRKIHQDMPEFATIWNADNISQESKRYFICEFSYNVDELYLNRNVVLEKVHKEYVFEMQHSHKVNKVGIIN